MSEPTPNPGQIPDRDRSAADAAAVEAAEPFDRAPAPARRRRRWPWWLAGGVLFLLLLLGGLLFAGWSTESGARALWRLAGAALPGRLSGEVVGGTLRDGLSLRNLRYADATTRIAVDRLEARWRLSRAPWSLDIAFLRAGTVDVTLLPSPEPPQPATLPQAIRLPLAVRLRSLTVDHLLVHKDVLDFPFHDLRFAAVSDGVRHTLDLERLDTPYGRLEAALRLEGVRPFATSGSARLAGSFQRREVNLDTRFSGTLQELSLQLDASGEGLSGHARVDATPFAPVPFRRVQIDMAGIDPHAIDPGWPQAALDLRVALSPTDPRQRDLEKLVVTGPVLLRNARPGALDKGFLPLVSADAIVRVDRQRQQLSGLLLRLAGGGTLSGSGEIQGKRGQLNAKVERLDLRALHGALKPTRLSGPLRARLAGDTQAVELDLADPAFTVQAAADMDLKRIALRSARLQSGRARLDLSGTLGRDERAAYALQGKLTEFDPARFLSTVQSIDARGAGAGKRPPRASRAASRPVEARINTEFSAQGALRPVPDGLLRFKVYDSRYDRLPMSGEGAIRFAGTRLLPSRARLEIAGNRARLDGSFGAPADRLRVDVDAPALSRLGFGLSGLLQLHGWVGGTLTRPVVDASYRAERLVLGDVRLDQLAGAARTRGVPGRTPDARIELDLRARGLHAGVVDFTTLTARVDGTYADHALRVEAGGRLRGQPLDLTLAARGRLLERPQGLSWDGALRTLENRSRPRVSLAAPLPLTLAPGRVEIGKGRLSVAQAVIDLQTFQFNGGRLRSAGSLSALDIGHVLGLVQQFTGAEPPVKTDLVLDGRWDLTLAERAAGFVRLERRSGDVRVLRDNALGLSELALRAEFAGGRVDLDARARAARIGALDADGSIGLQRVNGLLTVTPASALAARVQASLPSLQSIAALAGPQLSLTGSVMLDIAATGTVGAPKLTGTVNGDGLALTLYDQGIRLSDGVARLKLDSNVVEIQRLEFRGGEGTLRATGRVPLDRASRELTASVVADRLQLLASPGGQLTLSGEARAANADGRLRLTGRFTVDRALFSLPEKSAPKLGDDVVVVRGGRPPAVKRGEPPPTQRPASPYSPSVDVLVDLGNQFLFQGAGADLRLAGTLSLQSEPGMSPQAVGTVRVVEGTYEAFGAELAIERGLLNFQGPLSNPNVNILAMRRDQEVAAGVLVTGTVQRPRVQLVSEPDVPQEEKLSWLVFGRGGGSDEPGQAQQAIEGAAYSAAYGLLNKFGGERIAKRIGLDQLSVGESEYGLEGDGQVINLGKEISDRLYIGYEQSLAGAESVLRLSYELSQYWSVVVRGGTVTGVDVRYSRRFDSIRFGGKDRAAPAGRD